MKFRLIVLIGLAFLIYPNKSYSQTSVPEQVLFVGNSYTYVWNLPQNVALMAEVKSINLKTQQSTSGGANLAQHWRSEGDLSTVDKIKTGKFDAVVLQDQSMRAIQHPDSLMYYGERLGKLIIKNGGQPYVYMTWAREWAPNMQKTIQEKYTALAKKINARIVPVGPAWERARELRPGFPLYDPDGSHPSALGTYLSACVFFGVLTGESPVGLPPRLISKDQDGERFYVNIQAKEDVQFCQKVAKEIIREFQK